MTIVTNWYTMDNKEGVNLNQVQYISVSQNPDYPAPNAKLGDRVQGNNGSEWVFVQASTTVTAQMAVAIDTNFKANDLTSALAASGVYSYGIAEFQDTSADIGGFFWALTKANGGVAINVIPSANKGSALYISASVPGAFSSTNTGEAVNNIDIVVSITASGTAEAIMRAYMIPVINWTSASA